MKLEQIHETLQSNASLEERLQTSLQRLTEYLEAERGCMMVTRDGKELISFAGDEDLNLKFPFSRSVVSEAMVGNTGLVSFQEIGVKRDSLSSMAMHGVRAALCVPLLSPCGEDFGIVYFDTRMENKMFSDRQLKDVTEVAKEIGVLLQ